jgi:hypothetical protein
MARSVVAAHVIRSPRERNSSRSEVKGRSPLGSVRMALEKPLRGFRNHRAGEKPLDNYSY